MGKTSKDFRDHDRLARKRQKALRDNFKSRSQRSGSRERQDNDNIMDLQDEFIIYATPNAKEDK